MMLDAVYVDMAQGLVLGLMPKPEFLPLFNLGEPVTTGDSELVTVGWNSVELYRLNVRSVGNQQKWDTFVKERSRGCDSVAGLPEQVVVAFAAGQGLSFHLPSLDQDPFPSPP